LVSKPEIKEIFMTFNHMQVTHV